MKEKQLNDVMEFLKEKENRFSKDFNLEPMIKRDFPLEIIELLLKMGNSISCTREVYQSILNRRLGDTIDTLELLKKYGIKFDNEHAAEVLYNFIVEKRFGSALFIIDNGVDVHWNDNAIIKMAIIAAKEDEDYYEILKALFNAKTY